MPADLALAERVAITPSAVAHVPSRSRWLIGPWTDVATLILPVLIGYAFLYAHAGLGISSFLIWWFWGVALNGPHFYATISRTYLDRDEWRQRTPLLLGSLGWVLVGPIALWASIRTRSGAPFLAFWAFQVVWAYFHVARQHYGFLALYQRRHGEPSGRANGFDFWTFHLLMFAPVISWFLRFPDLRRVLGWSEVLSAGEQASVHAIRALVLVIVVAIAVRTVRDSRAGSTNLPKLLLLAAYVPLHLFILLDPFTAGAYDILLLNAVITAPHNVQYLAIVWFHNRNRYRGVARPSPHGWAVPANATLARFLALGAVYGIVFFYIRFILEGHPVPLLPFRLAWSRSSLGGMYTMADLAAAVWVGFVFQHQYLDQRIWKISRDARVVEDLRLARAA